MRAGKQILREGIGSETTEARTEILQAGMGREGTSGTGSLQAGIGTIGTVEVGIEEERIEAGRWTGTSVIGSLQ
jgi:hypothetical protein